MTGIEGPEEVKLWPGAGQQGIGWLELELLLFGVHGVRRRGLGKKIEDPRGKWSGLVAKDLLGIAESLGLG